VDVKREIFRQGSKRGRLFVIAAQSTALVAGWAIWGQAGLGQFKLALVYVLLAWVVAGGITLGRYVAFSLAPLPNLVVEAWRASASAMWLVPGTLLLADRSPAAVAAGVAAVIHSTRLLVLSGAPEGDAMIARRRAARESEPRLFGYQTVQPLLFWRERLPVMLGALALETGAFALARPYPLLAAVSFATVTAIWVGISVARGALESRAAGRALYAEAGVLLTMLCTVTLTAVLLNVEIVLESPVASAPAIDTGTPKETPGVTWRVLQRLAHGPPALSKIEEEGTKAVVTRVVDPRPAIGAREQNGVPGVVLRRGPMRRLRPALILPGARLRLSSAEPLAIPFTGEYELFRTSSGRLPKGSIVETGTPLDSLYGTTNGGPMETIAVQAFEPPIDLTHCGKVLVALTSAETTPLLASMQLVAERSVEDGGTELLGMRPAREETLEFRVPFRLRPILVHAIRILFQSPDGERNKNARVAVERITLVPR
jgi:hypothetical protein